MKSNILNDICILMLSPNQIFYKIIKTREKTKQNNTETFVLLILPLVCDRPKLLDILVIGLLELQNKKFLINLI